MKRKNVALRHPIRLYMTHSPHSVRRDETVARAEALMRESGIRHLPVVDEGRLVGMLSERDLYLLKTLKDVDPGTATVEAAMTPEVYAVTPETPLEEVAATMASHKYGSAVVFQGLVVVGIFTSVDALDTLARYLRHAA